MHTLSKHVLLLLFTVVIFACVSKTRVHVYAKYLSEQEQQNVSQKIEELGFSVVINKFGFPTNITGSSIIYSPMLRQPNSVDSLIDGMNSIGLKVNSVAPLVAGNHWYKKDSIALFLIPDDANSIGPILKQDLAETYQSRDCEKIVELKLDRNGSYQFMGEPWTEQQQLLSKGLWQYRQYPYVELRPEIGVSGYRYYEIIQAIEADKVSEIQMLKLVPQQAHQLVGNCKFSFGLRLLPN